VSGSIWELLKVQLKVGSLGFGGPLATIALMRQEWVERHKWVSEAQFLRGLAAVKLMPGPIATLLAVYLGMERGSGFKGVVSAIGFVIPSFVLILTIAIAESYLPPRWHEVSSVALPIQGLQVLIFAVITVAAWKLLAEAQKSPVLGRPRRLESLGFALLAVLLMALGVNEFWILAVCAGLGALWLWMSQTWFRDRLQSDPLSLFLIFFGLGFTVFGTGYALIPALHSALVVDRGWLSEEAFLQAILYGNLTPGPIVIASTYMGYQISGWGGAIAATLGVFGAPVLLMLLLHRHINRLLGGTFGQALLLGLLPAVAVTIAAAAWQLAQGLEWNWTWVLLFLLCLYLLHVRKINFLRLALAVGFGCWLVAVAGF
jgi:chromate transporter